MTAAKLKAHVADARGRFLLLEREYNAALKGAAAIERKLRKAEHEYAMAHLAAEMVKHDFA